ncbi:hypothetical protein AB7Z32_23950 [Bradyrhizobium sp. 482_C4_N1_1]|uniref:hypothetical protein n=1 Tax=unclassified Bradyrhizobium TaxID=2631580 RepID=UPI0033929984
MNINEAFPSKYLSAADLQGRPATVRMGEVNSEVLDRETKLILSLQGKKKQMVLNKTNAMAIAELHGAETNDWYDKVIEIYATEVEFQGKMTDAIRVRAPRRIETRSDQGADTRRDAPREPVREPAYADDGRGRGDDRRDPPRDDRSDFGRDEPPRRPATARSDMNDDIPF